MRKVKKFEREVLAAIKPTKTQHLKLPNLQTLLLTAAVVKTQSPCC